MARVTEMVCGFCLVHATLQRGVQVALVTKARPTWMAGKLNGIGGHVEPGEDAYAAMAREFAEETHYTAPLAWDRFASLEYGGARDRKLVNFFVTYMGPVARPIYGTGEEPVDWYSIDRLPGTVLPNLHWLIPMARGFSRTDVPLRIWEPWE